MKILIFITLVSTSLAFGRSYVPGRVVTPPLEIFSKNNKVLPNGDVRVSVSSYETKDFSREHGTRIISKAEFEKFQNLSKAVLIVDPKKTGEYKVAGSAVNIGENFVLTNHHVLDADVYNTTRCDGFNVTDYKGEKFDCLKVHYCSPADDMCLIEMKPKVKNDCLLSWRCPGYEVSLAQQPSLKIKAFHPKAGKDMDNVFSAIGNSSGQGIHFSQGRGVKITEDFFANQMVPSTHFWAPTTTGNSGGALVDADGFMIGIVKNMSKIYTNVDYDVSFNGATPGTHAIAIIRKALQNKPETLLKFNRSVVE